MNIQTCILVWLRQLEEGFEEIADWFETLAKAEKSHAGKFQKTLESIS